MAGLTVLMDHVAALRESTQSPEADPIAAALLAELAGADGIGVYLREDGRFIQEKDVRLLRQTLHTRLVLHMAASPEMIGIALDIRPERAVLMPVLSDNGTDSSFDMLVHTKSIFEIVDSLQSNNISVGVTIEPEPDQVKMVHQTHANWIYINAHRMRTATAAAAQTHEFNRILDAIKMAHRLRMHIALSGGLDHRLIKMFAGMKEIDEFSLGRSLISRAVLVGMDRAVSDMVALIRML